MFWGYVLENFTEKTKDNSPLFLLINDLDIEDNYLFFDMDTKEKVELGSLLKSITPQSTLLIRSIEDLGEDLVEVIAVLQALTQKGVKLLSCCEPFLNGTNYLQNLQRFLTLYKTFMERKKRLGYQKALSEGKVGRPSKSHNSEKGIELYKKGVLTLKQLQTLTGLSRSTLYRHLKGV